MRDEFEDVTLGELVEAVADALAPRVAELVVARLAAADVERDVTVDEAATMLGVSAETVRRRAREGALPAHREGQRLRIRVVDLEAYREARRVRPAPAPNALADRMRLGIRSGKAFRERLRDEG
jgi:excisionase family DNA binding protein